jgi:hypothetical protein
MTIRHCSLLVLLAFLAGCGSSDPFKYVAVSGDVKYEDGSLIEAPAVEVTFYPQAPPKDAKTHPRPAVGVVNVADGTFPYVTSRKPNDGVVPGVQKVVVKTFDAQHAETDVIPKEYTDPHTTPLTFDTTSGKKAEIRVKKK